MRLGRLFWKVFFACWLTALCTGLCIGLLATFMPAGFLPPPPGLSPPSVLPPVVAGALIALLFSALLAWAVLGPIRLLQGALNDAAAGRLDTRITHLMGRQRDEIADLGHSFDHMAQQIQALLSSQQRLLHDVSHELRSPLARLQVAVGLVRQSPHKLDTALQRIEREVERLDALVGEVLSLARLESGARRPAPQQADAVQLLASITADAAFEAQAAGRRVHFASSAASFAVDADGDLLRRAFDNVVRNAVKHSGPGTLVEVLVRAEQQGRLLRVEVADRGPGVAPAHLDSIFEAFFRGADSAGSGAGFGLGLAIARRAIELHGGRIAARLRDGGGLVVSATLPARGLVQPGLDTDLPNRMGFPG